MNLIHLRIYQSRRFYLDEYPEQISLRAEFFQKKNKLNKFIECINLLAESFKQFGISILDLEEAEKPDLYFYNRWLKRN